MYVIYAHIYDILNDDTRRLNDKLYRFKRGRDNATRIYRYSEKALWTNGFLLSFEGWKSGERNEADIQKWVGYCRMTVGSKVGGLTLNKINGRHLVLS